jgi:hypothetical protein
MSISRLTLADIVAKTQTEHSGSVLSVTPMTRDRKPVFVVLVADKGKVEEFVYSAEDGKIVPHK